MRDKSILLKRFGLQIRIFRKQKMLSREELAYRIRLPEKDIEALEAGSIDPGLSTIFLIAQALNLSPDELMPVSKRHDSEYHAYRFYLLQLINRMSKRDLKEATEILHSMYKI